MVMTIVKWTQTSIDNSSDTGVTKLSGISDPFTDIDTDEWEDGEEELQSNELIVDKYYSAFVLKMWLVTNSRADFAVSYLMNFSRKRCCLYDSGSHVNPLCWLCMHDASQWSWR